LKKIFFSILAVYLIVLLAPSANTWAAEPGVTSILTSLTGSYSSTKGRLDDVYVSGNYAYVSASGHIGSLQVIDITNPVEPSLKGSVDITEGGVAGFGIGGTNVYISGNYAYVAAYHAGLKIIDVMNPASPSIVGSHSQENVHGLYVSGNYAYVVGIYSGLKIIDITNPASPSLKGSYYQENATRVYVSGNYAYVIDRLTGLHIIDISNPASPSLKGSYEAKGQAREIYVSGNYAYVSVDGYGLDIVDISNPTSPSLTGNFPDGAPVYDVSGSYAYAVFKIIDITNPASPSLASSYSTLGGEGGVNRTYAVGNYTYTIGMKGLEIIKASANFITSYRDADSDGYGNPNDSVTGDTVPDGYVNHNTDCNDDDSNINPGVSEICGDDIDQDCTGGDLVICKNDSDGDGFYKEDDDCDDSDNSVHPGATEIPNDEIDQNCDNQDFKCQSRNSNGYTYTNVDYPGADKTYAQGINDLGVVVGTYYVGDDSHAFIYDKNKEDKYSNIDYSGATDNMAYDINDSGKIVGTYDINGEPHSFLYDNGTYINIDFPGGGFTEVRSINNSDTIVGWYMISFENFGKTPTFRGFIYKNGVHTAIDYPDASVTKFYHVYDNEKIYGGAFPGAASLIYENGTFAEIGVGAHIPSFLGSYDSRDLPPLEHPDSDKLLTFGVGINSLGYVVGDFKEISSGRRRGFIAKPEVSSCGPSILPITTISTITSGKDFTTETEISYDIDIKTPVLYYRSPGDAYIKVSMTNGGGNTWTATVEASKLTDMDEIEYYISAEGKDGSSVGTEPKTVEITAPPVPTLSEWGIFMLVAAFGFVFWKRREIAV